MKTITSYIILLICFCACQSNNKAPEKLPGTPNTIVETPIFHISHEEKKQDAPFSDVVQIGNMYYLSGQIGMNHKTRTLVEGGIETETRQTLENIKEVLAQNGLEMTDVVKAMVVLDDIKDFSTFNKIYMSYFPQKPARTTFAAESLAVGAKIEIEVLAVKSE